MRKRMFAGLAAAAVMMLSAPALAEGWTRGYGGSGMDRLTELTEYEGGLIAVGETSSTDGDLQVRTRSNSAGWMMRLDGSGALLWNCCTAKNGRSRMRSVYVHENGQISAALQGEGVAGFEWLIVSGEGRILRRVEAPEIGAVCAHGGGEMFAKFYDRDGEPHTALIVRHEDETCCVADMDAAGRVSRGLSFVVCMETSFAPCADGSGRMAMAYSYDGEAGVLFVKPGTDEVPEKVVIEGITSDAAPILMPLEDGSVLVGGQQEYGGGYLARINALGETMFAVSIDDPPDRMAVTPSGFVLHMMQLNRLYDFDEDGNLLGIREVEYERDPYMEVLEDMADLDGETALLMDAESVGGSRAEIVFVSGEGISVPDDEYSHALYHESGCVLQDVWPQKSGVLALIERSDGQRVGLSIDADGNVSETEAPEPRERNRQAVSGGTLSWSEEPGGAVVTLEDGQGREIWRVRTMIHIAADRLEWLCAQELPDGNYVLGGRYLTGDGAVKEQAATMAVIGPEGVLREIVPIQSGEEDTPIGCVCDMAYDPQRGLLLLTARGGQTKNGACDIQTADGRFDIYVHVGFESEDARLMLDDFGYAYVCGTDRDNGQNITAVVHVDLDTGEAAVQK